MKENERSTFMNVQKYRLYITEVVFNHYECSCMNDVLIHAIIRLEGVYKYQQYIYS